MGQITFLCLALALVGCSDNRPDYERRESMVRNCIGSGNSNPVDCANAAEITIPRKDRQP